MLKRNYNKDYFENALYKAESFSARDKARLETILQYKDSGNLLEIGCGEGYLLQLLDDYFAVNGVEVSEYAANLAEQTVGADKITLADVESQSLARNYYDVVVAFNILEHLSNPKMVLNKINQTLKPEGILLGSVPNNYGTFGGLVTRAFNLIDKTHTSTYKVPHWRQLFNQTGFIKVAEFGELPVSRNKSFYFNNSTWPYYSFNYMFVYRV